MSEGLRRTPQSPSVESGRPTGALSVKDATGSPVADFDQFTITQPILAKTITSDFASM